MPVPCLRVLALSHPVRAYYTALRDGKGATPPDRSDSYLALTRRDYVVRLHELSPLQYRMLGVLMEGETLGRAIGTIAEAAGAGPERLDVDLRLWFRDWVIAGFFRSVEAS